MTELAFTVVILAFAAVTIVTTGRKKRYGWMVGVASEGVWYAYAYYLRSWGVAAMATFYLVLYLRNWFLWREA